MHPRIYKAGQVFGRLTITEAYTHKIGKRWYHAVLCSCGKAKHVCGGDMTKGTTSSCGCIRLQHAMTNSTEYKRWAAMIQRCKNPNCKAFKNYGGRGIDVCDRWLDFNNFFADMGSVPANAKSLERVDNNKGYSKDNCVWASRSDQSINQRIRIDNKTGYKGVSFDKSNDRYIASISRNNKRTYLGSFECLDDAISARKSAEQSIGE